LPLRQKLLLKSNLIAAVAALVVAGVFAGYRLLSLRADQLADALAITRMVAENSAGPAAFHDAAAAATALGSLRAKPSISGAVIDLGNHEDLAVFGRPPPAADRLPPQVDSRFRGWILHTAAPIGDDETHRARLEIVSDLRPELWATLRAVVLALAASLALALALSHFVSNRLRRFILGPIEALHAATQRVRTHVDYSYRVPVIGGDELGELTAAFNGMLERLQGADTELRAINVSLKSEIAERRRLEKALVETSRHAGMAEVATGILHNVGNVLNSVNISAQLMRENLDRSQLKNLQRSADLIRSQGDQLARFLSEDPRGQLLPGFLVGVAEAMAGEHTAAGHELGQLTKNVEHIKEIIAAQQAFAKMVGVIERVTPQELFEEAERIAHASMLRHGVEVAREFGAVPAIHVDRHRCLQILVNFVTNAIHAVKGNAPGNRRIRLLLAAEEKTVAFSVIDNGVGIAAENLQRIFTHGFTTRQGGHGFGLHSGALAARLLGGQVKVTSDGPGYGAAFTVQLPLELVPTTSETVSALVNAA